MFFAGLRPCEARGARWEYYDGKTLNVKQSVWGKHTTDPKTASAAKPVLVIKPLRELLAELRDVEGNPLDGPILRGVKREDGKPKPLNLNWLAREVSGQHSATRKTTAQRRNGGRLNGKASTHSGAALPRT